MPRGRPRLHASNLPPSVYKSHGAYYHVVKGAWHPLGRELETALAEYARRVSPTTEHQLDVLIDASFKRMRERKVKPLRPNTVKLYTRAAKMLKHLLRKFARPDQVKQKDAAMVKLLLAPKPMMANHVISFGRSVFADFVEQQLVDNNPFQGIKRHDYTPRKRLITAEQWSAIYKVAVPRLQCMMDGMRLTDQRVMDVVTLDERAIHDDGPGIEFTQEKTGKKLIVEWNPELREWVARCRSLHKKVVKVDFTDPSRARPLFRGKHGRCPSYRTVYIQWRAACELAGVEPTQMRDIRAYSATVAEEQGLNPQELLGHTERQTTSIYLRNRKAKLVKGPQFKTGVHDQTVSCLLRAVRRENRAATNRAARVRQSVSDL